MAEEGVVVKRGRGRPRKDATVVDMPRRGVSEDKAESSRVGARQQIIREACRRLAGLEAERRSVSEEISELKAKMIKGDLGMKLSDFSVAYRLYKLEGDDRSLAVETLRECFLALAIGSQGELFPAAE